VINLNCDKTLTIKYIGIPEELSVILEGLNNGSRYSITINNQTYLEDSNMVKFTLPAGQYCVKIDINGVTKTFIINLIQDEEIVINASSFYLTTNNSTITATSHIGSNSNNSLSLACYIAIALVVVALIFIIIVIRRRQS
jgi:hypothetical protein